MINKKKPKKLKLEELANLAFPVSEEPIKPIIAGVKEKEVVEVVIEEIEEFPASSPYRRETNFFAIAPDGYHYDRIMRLSSYSYEKDKYEVATGEYKNLQQVKIKFKTGQELIDLGWKICSSYDEVVKIIAHPLKGKKGNWKDPFAWSDVHIDQVQGFVDKNLAKWTKWGDFLIFSEITKDFENPSEIAPDSDLSEGQQQSYRTIFLDTIGRKIAELPIKSEEYIEWQPSTYEGEVGINSWHDKGYW